MKLLVEFQMIYDLEIGLYKHIIEEYDEQYFHFYKTDDMFLKEMIVQNMYKDRLKLIISKDLSDKSDQLFNQMMDEEYDSIFDKGQFTDFYEFIKNAIKNKHQVYILCKKLREQQLCESLGLKTIMFNGVDGDWNDKLLTEFDAYYFRYFNRVSDDIDGKNIYIGFNMYSVVTENKKTPLYLSNNVKFINVYNIRKPQ